jgi:hypothetical protein
VAEEWQPRWGTCACGGTFDTRQVEVRATVAGEVKTLENVYQGACPRCDARVYKAYTLELIEVALMRPGAALRAP